MRKSFKVIANAGISMFAHVLEMLGLFYLVPFTRFRLGHSGFAVAELGLSLHAMIYLLCAGTSTAAAQCISAKLATDSERSVSEFMSTAVMHGAATGIIAVIACSVLAAWPGLFVGTLEVEWWGQFSTVALIVGVGSLLAFLAMPFQGLLFAHQRYGATEGIRSAMGLARVGAVVVAFTLWRPSPALFMLATSGAYLLTYASYAFLARRLMPDLRIDPRLVRRWAIGALFGFSLLLLLGQAAVTLYIQGSKWLVLHLLSAETMADFAILMKIPFQLYLLFGMGMRVLIPVVSEQGARNEDDATRLLLRRGTRMGSLLAFIVLVMLAPLAIPLVRLWLSDDYVWLAPHLALVLLSQLIGLPAACGGQSLLGMGRVGMVLLLTAGTATLAAAALVIGHALGMGFGAMTLSLAVFFAVRGIANHVTCLIITKDSPLGFVWGALLRPALFCAPVGVAAWWMIGRYDIHTWPGLLFAAAASGSAMLLAALAALPKEDRTLVAAILTAVKQRIRGR